MKTPINSIGILFYFFSISSNVFFLSLQTVKLISWRLFRYLLCVHFLSHRISCPILVIYILNCVFFYYHLVRWVLQYSITVLWTFEVVSTFLPLNIILSISANNLYTRQEQPIFSHFLLIVQYIQMSPIYSRVPWFCSEPRCLLKAQQLAVMLIT